MRPQAPLVLAACVAFLTFGLPERAALAQKDTAGSVTEVFRVSRVGRPNAIENRDLLRALYGIVETGYNREVERERAAVKKAYKGKQVRILKVLDENDTHGQLYLCVYDGGPKVMSIGGDRRFSPGDLTPALKIEEDGEHTTTMTRVVKTKKQTDLRPQLEVVDDSSGGAVTFFGIPLVFDDGPSSSNSAPKPKPKPKPKPRPDEKTVSETKTFTKYTADISTELLDEGPPLLSTALFLELVKNGRVFQAERNEQRRCQKCRGFGRITDDVRRVGSRDPDGKMPCPECAQVGKRDWHVTYLMAW